MICTEWQMCILKFRLLKNGSRGIASCQILWKQATYPVCNLYPMTWICSLDFNLLTQVMLVFVFYLRTWSDAASFLNLEWHTNKK